VLTINKITTIYMKLIEMLSMRLKLFISRFFSFVKLIETLSMHHKLLIPSIFAFVTLMLFYYPTTSLSLDYFHNDDSRLMGQLNNLNDFHSTFNFIFSLEFSKFRPVANFQYVIEHFIFLSNYGLYVLYNICLVVILNYIFLLFVYEKTSLLLCLMIPLILTTSKFVIFSIWNIAGSFESLAVIIFLLIVLSLFTGSKSPRRLTFLGLLLIFTSERYLPFLVVLPIIYYYINTENTFIQSILSGAKYSAAIVMTYFAFRYSLGLPLIVGTQTDNVIEGFSADKVASHVIKAYGEILGFSVGPRYLTGFEFASWVPFDALLNNTVYIRGLFISLFLLIVSVYYFILKCCVTQRAILGFSIICLMLILAGSITFRLELRWLLPSYLMLLLTFSSYRSFGKCDDASFNIRRFDRVIFFSFIFFSVLNNVYYAMFFRRGLYFAEKLHDTSIIVSLWSLMPGGVILENMPRIIVGSLTFFGILWWYTVKKSVDSSSKRNEL
jgi:hypothetical protein